MFRCHSCRTKDETKLQSEIKGFCYQTARSAHAWNVFFFFFLNPDFSNSGTSPPPDFSKFRTLKCVSEKGLGSAGDHVTWREETRLFFFSFTLCMGLPCSSNNESLILLASGYNQFGELRASLFSSRRGLFFFLVKPPLFFFFFWRSDSGETHNKEVDWGGIRKCRESQ